MSGISAHVLDTALGRPAVDLVVRLFALDGGGGATLVSEATTNADGRVADLLAGTPLRPGTYRLTFVTGPYLEGHGQPVFFPEVDVTFAVGDAGQHYHIPLLLSPFAYSTYRGS